MGSLATIELSGLAGAQHKLGAVPGYTMLWPAAPCAPAAPLHVIGTPEQREALAAVNAAAPAPGPLGCSFLTHVAVTGSGYLQHGDDAILDGSELSEVAAEWITRPMPDSPQAIPPAYETWVDRPAIVAISPGHLIYGHWLLDLLPRFMIAREVMGRAFYEAAIILPHDTPSWAQTMLVAFTGADRDQFVFYQRGIERMALRQACIPSYVHQNYSFHPYASAIYASLATRPASPRGQKLCLSRIGFERATAGVHKVMQNRSRFEEVARQHGYRVIRPETMPLHEQAGLFAAASHVVGEFGSGLHSSVFGPAGQRVGMIRCPGPIQLRLSAFRRQTSVVVMPEDDRVAASGILEYTLSEAEMAAFFAAMDS